MNSRRGVALLVGLLLAATLMPAPARDVPPRSHSPAVAGAAVSASFARAADLPAAGLPAAVGPPASAEEPRVIIGARTTRPLVALTFDLDMTALMAAQLRQGLVSGWINQDALGVLHSSGTPATLFMTGMWAELYPGLAHSLAVDPLFEIGNHSYSHPAFHLPCYLLGGVSASGAAWQLSHSQSVIKRITGLTPRYFRFPGGCYDRAALDAVHSAGLLPVEWSVNAMDAFNPNASRIAAAVLAQVKPGGIVMMHLQGGPNAPATATALRIIIPALAERGYRFVKVSDLLQDAVALQPFDPNATVQAYQPTPPTATPTPYPVPLLRPAPVIRFYPTPPPCWRWNVLRKVWTRC